MDMTVYIYFTLLFGIYCGRQSKNFIVQGNMLSVCTHDNKHFELN